jgi:hypothetical protein
MYTVTWTDWVNHGRAAISKRMSLHYLRNARAYATDISQQPFVTDVKIICKGHTLETYYRGQKQTPLFPTRP